MSEQHKSVVEWSPAQASDYTREKAPARGDAEKPRRPGTR